MDLKNAGDWRFFLHPHSGERYHGATYFAARVATVGQIMSRQLRMGWFRSRKSVGRRKRGIRFAGQRDGFSRTLWHEPLEDRRLLATITVNTLVDEFNGVGIGAGTSLRDAIFAAAPGDTIAFSVTGTMNLTALGAITINKGVTISGPGAELLVIRAHDPTPSSKNGDGARVFNVDDDNFENAIDVSINDLALTGGDITDKGGAIFNNETLSLARVTISGNNAGEGGGVASRGKLTIRESSISGNTAGRGGGVYSSAVGSSKDLTIIDSRITGNTATFLGSAGSGRGGGVYAQGKVTIRSSTLSGNSAESLGGGFLGGPTGGEISESNISGNFAASGGGMFNFGGLAVKFSTIHANTATIGGAIRSEGDLRVLDSTLSGNFAAIGSAISILSAPVEVTRSTITGNHATNAPSGGGALSLALTGGAVNQLVVRNSIIAGNTSAAGSPDVNLSGDAAQSFHFSLIGNNSGSNLVAAPVGSPDALGNLIGTSSNPINPLLGMLGDNGGPTFTHALLAGSPAVNAGDPDASPGEDDVPPHDQRGAPYKRVSGARIDIGAFELQPTIPALFGDYNQNNHVDAADYVVWRKTLGSSGVPEYSGADGDGDGTVDDGDYAVWRVHFGQAVPAGGVVIESRVGALAEPVAPTSAIVEGGVGSAQARAIVERLTERGDSDAAERVGNESERVSERLVHAGARVRDADPASSPVEASLAPSPRWKQPSPPMRSRQFAAGTVPWEHALMAWIRTLGTGGHARESCAVALLADELAAYGRDDSLCEAVDAVFERVPVKM
jgi:hypothetical protein